MTTYRELNHLPEETLAPPILSAKWLAWNREQTQIVGCGKTRSQAKAAAAVAGEAEPVLENVKKTRARLGDLYAGGKDLVTKLLQEEGEPLTGAQMAAHLDISTEEVEDRHAQGSLLALTVGEGTVLYPSWQLVQGGLLPCLPEVLADLRTHNPHPLAQLRFFLSHNLRLEGQTPLKELRRGRFEEVRQAARAYGEHGAA